MAQVIPLRPHTFRLDNGIIDDYAVEMGAIGVAMYTVLQRYADRTTGQCWPSVATIARLLRLSKNCVKKYLHHLARLGLITIAPRSTADGDPTSNLYTIHDPTQRDAVLRRQRERGGAPAALPPPQDNGHLVPQGGAPAGHEQDPHKQETLTSTAEAKTAAPACNHPGHEQVGRFDRPGAQHNTVGFDGENLPPAFGFHADGLAILDHDLPDEHPAPHRQVQIGV